MDLTVTINEQNIQMDALQVNLEDSQEDKASLEIEVVSLHQQIELKDLEITSLHDNVSSLEDQLSETLILGVYFSPDGGCEDQILYWISRANASIQIMVYSFTLDSIGDALIEASDRGVEVLVVFEENQLSQYSEYQKLLDAGISVRTDSNSRSMHNKVMIVDGVIVITGSFNYSNNGENYNNENIIVVNSIYIAGLYGEEFLEIWDESQTPNGPIEDAVVIEIVHYDAEGNDQYNLNDEYVVIWNKKTADIDLSGWKLKDEFGHTYTFPSFTLQAGQKVTVYTGSGVDSDIELYWGSNNAIWNNDHDTAYLYDQESELIDSYSW